MVTMTATMAISPFCSQRRWHANKKMEDAFQSRTAGTVAVKLMNKAAAAAAQAQKPNTQQQPQPKGKAKAKAKARKSDLKKGGAHVALESCGDVIEVDGEQRPRVWLDDVFSAMHFALGEPDVKAVIPTSLVIIVAHAVRMAWIFAFTEQVTIATAVHTKWSVVRKIIQQMVAAAYDNYNEAQQKDAEQSLPMDAAALRKIINDIGATEEDEVPADGDAAAQKTTTPTLTSLRAFSEQDVKTMREWSSSVANRPVRFHVHYIAMQEQLVMNVPTISTVVGLCTAVRIALEGQVPAATWHF